MTNLHFLKESSQAVAPASEQMSNPSAYYERNEQMDIITPKSLKATIQNASGQLEILRFGGKRAFVLTKLIVAGKAGISRLESCWPDNKLAEHITALRSAGINICNIGSSALPTYVLVSTVRSLAINY